MTRPGRLTDPETAWAPVSWGGAGSHNVLSQGADGEGQQVPLEVGDSGDPLKPGLGVGSGASEPFGLPSQPYTLCTGRGGGFQGSLACLAQVKAQEGRVLQPFPGIQGSWAGFPGDGFPGLGGLQVRPSLDRGRSPPSRADRPRPGRDLVPQALPRQSQEGPDWPRPPSSAFSGLISISKCAIPPGTRRKSQQRDSVTAS